MRLRLRTPTARPRPRGFGLALSLALAASAASSSALAAECQPKTGLSTCIDADNLWPHAGGGGFFSIGPTLTTPAGRSSFGLVLSYFSRPVGLRVASADPQGTVIFALDNVVDTTFLWAIGVTDRLDLTIVLPVTIYQDGAGLSDVLGSDDELPRSAVRDGRAGVSFAIVPRPRKGPEAGFGLNSRLEFGLPVGANEAFASAGSRSPPLARD